jgi:DNA-directed RNA polymerase subunit RPC12/RpoP
MKRQDMQRSKAASVGVACPFCGSTNVELLALFGSQLLTDQYYCSACRTPFEHLRADDEEGEGQEEADPAGLACREE